MFKQACLDSGIPKNLLQASMDRWLGKEKDKKVVSRISKSILDGKRFNVALIGDYDTGKSYLSTCITKSAIKNKLPSRIIDFKDMMDLFEGKRFEDIFYTQYRKLRKHKVIIIDGINEEIWRSYKDWARVTFVQLINKFIEDSDALLIMLNIDLEETGNNEQVVQLVMDKFGYYFSKMITVNFVPYKLGKISTPENEDWSKIIA